jgi:hypothetical protein
MNDFKSQVREGILLLPEPKPWDPSVNHPPEGVIF